VKYFNKTEAGFCFELFMKQAGAELCQAQVKLSKLASSFNLRLKLFFQVKNQYRFNYRAKINKVCFDFFKFHLLWNLSLKAQFVV
jgi:hypothetical protein